MPDRQRLLSVLTAPGYITAMWRREGWHAALALPEPPTLSLGMIWSAGNLSCIKTTGWASRRIDRRTPPPAIRVPGWVLLLIPAVVILAQRLRTV